MRKYPDYFDLEEIVKEREKCIRNQEREELRENFPMKGLLNLIKKYQKLKTQNNILNIDLDIDEQKIDSILNKLTYSELGELMKVFSHNKSNFFDVKTFLESRNERIKHQKENKERFSKTESPDEIENHCECKCCKCCKNHEDTKSDDYILPAFDFDIKEAMKDIMKKLKNSKN